MAKKFNEMFTEEDQGQVLNEGPIAAGLGAVAKAAGSAIANKALGMVGLPNLATIKGIFDSGYKTKLAQEQKVEAMLAPGPINPAAKKIATATKQQLGKVIDSIIQQQVPVVIKAYVDDKAKKIPGFMVPDAKGKPTNVTPEAWVASIVENATKSLFDQYKSKYADPAKSKLTKEMIETKFPPTPAPGTPEAAPTKPGEKPAAPAGTAPAAGGAAKTAAAPAAGGAAPKA